MSLIAEKVVAASNAWSWIPDNAATEATEEYLLVRFPDYFEHPLELLRFSPAASPWPTTSPACGAAPSARKPGARVSTAPSWPPACATARPTAPPWPWSRGA
jgi:hypothetical protein